MKKAIITGATGMIGGIVLQHCLQSGDIDEIVSITRRPSEIKHPKLKEVIHSHFTNFNAIHEHFKNVDIAFFCIGVYTGAVPNDKFKEITVDYTKAFADVLNKVSKNSRLCFLSGAGADRTEKNPTAFAKYKGIAENYLFNTLENVHAFRPAYIYPVKKRNEPNLMYRVFRRLYPLIKLLGKGSSIKSTQLSEAMFKVGLQGANKEILENNDIIDQL